MIRASSGGYLRTKVQYVNEANILETTTWDHFGLTKTWLTRSWKQLWSRHHVHTIVLLHFEYYCNIISV
jgi:hypothetical protein